MTSFLQTALKEKKQHVTFLDKLVNVNKNAGIFVTMNPAGKGYGGRSKLPDNLKQLFRSVAMTVPDDELIAEVMLLSEGFKCAKEFGKKLVSLFQICSQILSHQLHYDWGLRALKTTLTTAGKLLRAVRNINLFMCPCFYCSMVFYNPQLYACSVQGSRRN